MLWFNSPFALFALLFGKHLPPPLPPTVLKLKAPQRSQCLLNPLLRTTPLARSTSSRTTASPRNGSCAPARTGSTSRTRTWRSAAPPRSSSSPPFSPSSRPPSHRLREVPLVASSLAGADRLPPGVKCKHHQYYTCCANDSQGDYCSRAQDAVQQSANRFEHRRAPPRPHATDSQRKPVLTFLRSNRLLASLSWQVLSRGM